ncbi:MAG TPA: outer membrane lipoprotein-sorting protein [Treponema sp.]|mgnify:FL=1|nr:outer membrane lipoprotein-sorting protein [Treponema sp.]HRS05112.1 outer membrane lipoprotein-sorting protein [Treponema sp.]HRU28962.1 outer membrane lipoprotein-sorting protein [Treponema sp.]
MLRRNVTTVILAALISLGPTIGVFAQDINLDALLARNENQPRPTATEGDMKMIIINKAGQQRVREIKAYSKTEADGTTKQSLIFLSPADVRDTRFLTIDYKDPAKDDEQYIYIPALRKVRTIGTSGGESKTGAFLGSDFTFADIGALDRKDFTVKLLGPDTMEGRQYAKVEYTAKSPQVVKNYGYSKIVRWIDLEHATTKQSEYYDASGKLVKRLVIQNQRLVDGKYWQFDAMEMQNLETGGKTIWQFVKTTILPSIDDKYFTVRFIERGR